MKVSETFISIQGEGPLQGRPAMFIRLAGCNLSCSFCDTPYAQKGEGAAVPFTIEGLRDDMLTLSRLHGLDYPFVITGGEPLLQQDGVRLLLGAYYARSPRLANVWFETNGTIDPNRELLLRYRAKFVVSPKVGHINLVALKALSNAGAQFKFVVDDTEGWNFGVALEFAKEFNLSKERIWMQPLGSTTKQVMEAGKKLWQKCCNHGVGFSPRIHTLLYGNKRGI